MKDNIIKLRQEGKTYDEIKKELGCSKGTISYHCGEGQKDKNQIRQKKRRTNEIIKHVDCFTQRKFTKNKNETIRKFQKAERIGNKRRANKELIPTFTWQDIVEKFGINTNCYLTGVPINLLEDSYSFDHIIPVSKNGKNSLDNLGICLKDVNMMKSDFSLGDFIDKCKKVLEYNGYIVKNIGAQG